MIKSLEERIVNLTKVTTDNVQTTVEAELRQLKMEGGNRYKFWLFLLRKMIFNLLWIGTVPCQNFPLH